MKKVLFPFLSTMIYVVLMMNLKSPENIIGVIDMFFVTGLYVASNYIFYLSIKSDKENSSN